MVLIFRVRVVVLIGWLVGCYITVHVSAKVTITVTATIPLGLQEHNFQETTT